MGRYTAEPLENKLAWMRERQQRKREKESRHRAPVVVPAPAPAASPQPPAPLPQYHKVQKVAQWLGVSDRTVRRWFRKHALIVPGPCGTKSTWLIPHQAVEDWIRRYGPSSR